MHYYYFSRGTEVSSGLQKLREHGSRVASLRKWFYYYRFCELLTGATDILNILKHAYIDYFVISIVPVYTMGVRRNFFGDFVGEGANLFV